ncbi:hypothetical protein PQX77_018166 [Marasmius sp. AFHP31]|nr:hypothetical protein PQX77_018166 [Marasmius sp. AFHP31]
MPVANKPLSRPRGRPKGLWKARVTFTVTHPPPSHSEPTTDDDEEDEDDQLGPEHSYPNKRRRLDVDVDEEEDQPSASTSAIPSPPPSPTSCCGNSNESEIVSRARIMDISSVAHGNILNGNGNGRPVAMFNYEDWEDLKDLFASAAQQYETAEPSEALPLIRGVIHECHRFQKDYQDPSTLFANPATAPTGNSTNNNNNSNHSSSSHQSSRGPSPSDSRRRTTTTNNHRASSTHSYSYTYHSTSERKKCTCLELPTAFHAIFGTALFLFGNLIAQDPTLTLPGEPNSPMAYWTAAIDVFETGENLPTRTHGLNACDAPEDWRMAVVWGRTLVCLADERVTRIREDGEDSESQGEGSSEQQQQQHPIDGGEEDTPFTIIAQRRPPLTNRTSLITASPTHLLKLAMDQFSRGIFHMPHPEHEQQPSKLSSSCPSSSKPKSSKEDLNFSRAKELYTLASEVLLVSEKLPQASERRYWANWADSIFNQMQMEKGGARASERGEEGKCESQYRVDYARGRCCLIVGSAIAEGVEDALEQEAGDAEGEGGDDVLDGEEAEEAREYLTEAVGFFEKARARGYASGSGKPQEQKEKQGRKQQANGIGKSTKKRKRELDDVDGGDEHSPPSSKPKATETSKSKDKGPAMSLPTPPTVPSTPMYTPITSPSGASPSSYFSPLQPPPSTVSSDEDEEEEDAEEDESGEEKEEDELGDLLAEALLTLANLTKDEKKREELYARAEKESGGKLSLGGEEEEMVVS